MAKSKKKKKNLTDILRSIVLVLSLLVMIGCGVYLFFVYFPNDETPHPEISYELLFNDYASEKERFIDYVRNLRNENNDLVGYICVKDTKINYPVVKAKDNDFYINHNFYKKYDRHGAIFMDCDTNVDSLNWLIYGHHMKDGTMFAGMRKLTSKSYFEKHSEIIYTTLEDSYIFDIIAVVYISVDDPNFQYYRYNNIHNQADYDAYVAKMKSLSIFNTGNTASYGDQLITMSTCRDANSPRRIVIVARKRS